MSWIVKDIGELVEFLRTKAEVYGPVGGESIAYEKLDGQEPNLSRLSDVSARHLFQPMTHYYLHFDDRPNAEAVFNDYDVSPRVVLGVRPCDVAALSIHDSVFAESASHKALRDATAVVGLLCSRREATCFCDSMGGGPHDREGMDIVVCPTDDGRYVIEAATDAGKTLMEGAPLEPASGPPEPSFDEDEHPTLDTEGLPAALAALAKVSEDSETAKAAVWDEVGFACVNCRICTYSCPTCHCFTVTDEVFGTKGGRATVWDSCQNKLFTKEASGRNPRRSKVGRVRQRILHKYCYYPEVHGELMCTGCGRCISGCPTGRSIVEELSMLREVARS